LFESSPFCVLFVIYHILINQPAELKDIIKEAFEERKTVSKLEADAALSEKSACS
jgi:hypothetical protein